jgi:hypothetical protein
MVEGALAVLAIVVTVLIWIFPPEPLRRWFGISPGRTKDSEASEGKAGIPKGLSRRFAQFIKERPALLQSRADVLSWIDEIDDELLLVAVAMAKLRGKTGVTQSWISSHSHAFGRGRSVQDLIAELHSVGLLAPSTEEIPPGTYHEMDAKRNPGFNFGRMLRVVRPLLDEAEAAGIFKRT